MAECCEHGFALMGGMYTQSNLDCQADACCNLMYCAVAEGGPSSYGQWSSKAHCLLLLHTARTHLPPARSCHFTQATKSCRCTAYTAQLVYEIYTLAACAAYVQG